jgi:hypothetical protein
VTHRTSLAARLLGLVLGLVATAGCAVSVAGSPTVQSLAERSSSETTWVGNGQHGNLVYAVLLQWGAGRETVDGTVKITMFDVTWTPPHPGAGRLVGTFDGTMLTATMLFDQLPNGADADNDTARIRGDVAGGTLTLHWLSRSGSWDAEDDMDLHLGTAAEYDAAMRKLLSMPLQTPTSTPSSTVDAAPTLDRSSVESEVRRTMADPPPQGYGLTRVTAVTCPAGQAVVPGSTFTCTMSVDDVLRSVTVTVVDETGGFTVGPPR